MKYKLGINYLPVKDVGERVQKSHEPQFVPHPEKCVK